MANPSGSFIWYELMTPEPDSATSFYGAVVGWTIGLADPGRTDGMDYRMIGRSDGKHAGGVLRITDDMRQNGAQPLWLGYLHVPDAAAAIAAIVADGGKVQMPVTAIPGVGNIAMVADPQGVPFYVMTPTPPPDRPDATSDVFSPTDVERVGWNELSSPDLAASKAFYSRHFGFEFKEVMNMGPMGDYCFIDHDGVRLGAIMQKRSAGPATWLFYFRVDSLGAAQRAIEAGGGKVTQGPQEVPGNEWVIAATDPAGAAFGVVSARRD